MSIPHDCWGGWVDTVLRKYLEDYVAWCVRGDFNPTNPRTVDTYLRECYKRRKRA